MRGESEEIFLMRNLPMPQNNITSSSSSFNDIDNDATMHNSFSSINMDQEPIDKAVQTDGQTTIEMENYSTEIEDPTLQTLQNQLAVVMIRTTKEIMVKAKEFNNDLLAQQNSILAKEAGRHAEEKQAFSEEIEDLESNIQTLKAIVHKNSEVLMYMDKKLETTQNNKVLLKYFLRWKTVVKDTKREELLLWIARKHYEQNLKKKTFNSWMKLLRFNWKKRVELKITMEVYENQKSIVQNYEAKIRTLQENAFKFDKQIKTLHRSFEDSMQMAYVQGLSRSKEQISSSDLVTDDSNAKAPEEDRLDDCANLYNLCNHCVSHLSDSGAGSSSAFSDVPHVNYRYVKDVIPKPMSKVHPSALPKRLPVMGTATHYCQNKATTITLCPGACDTVSVERHIPVNELSSVHSPKRISNLKSRTKKKLM